MMSNGSSVIGKRKSFNNDSCQQQIQLLSWQLSGQFEDIAAWFGEK
jgi:hypothetical protein